MVTYHVACSCRECSVPAVADINSRRSLISFFTIHRLPRSSAADYASICIAEHPPLLGLGWSIASPGLRWQNLRTDPPAKKGKHLIGLYGFLRVGRLIDC